MQQALQVFQTHDHHDFRTVQIDGEPWFVARDVAEALDYVWNGTARIKHVPAEWRGVTSVVTPFGVQQLAVLSEQGLYFFLGRSDKPKALPLQKWVAGEVLPAIRRTGAYGGGRVPAFIRRFQENFDRVDEGYFSIINELVVRLWGRLEMAGYVMPDRAMDGKELRPDVSVGKRFTSWLEDNHPEEVGDHSYYVHSTPQVDVHAKQYPRRLLPLYLDFIDRVWIPECAEDYFRKRDPRALVYLPLLLPSPDKPKPGMVRAPTWKRLAKR